MVAQLIPVSYTHLDVYKRQALATTISGTGGMLVLFYLLRRRMRRLGLKRIVPDPVSYTHLDVYKRQVRPSASVTPSAHAVAQTQSARININANNLRMFRPPVHTNAIYLRMIIPHVCPEIATAL